MADDTLQLRDVAPVDPFLPDWVLPWWMWVAGGLVLVGMVCLIIALARRPAKPSDGVSTADLAYRKAIATLDSLPDDFHDAVIGSSTALRAYLADAAGDPSLFETHEEFTARPEALETLPAEMRPKVSSYLTSLSQLKYDRPRSDSGAEVKTSARSMLDQIHQSRPA